MTGHASLRAADAIVLLIYLAAMAAMGFYFSTRNRSTEQYFLGDRAFPGWAVGLSMVGTSISSVTFLAFPAAAFTLDWRLVVPNLMLPFIAVLAMFVFIPFFRRGQLTSAFEYLEMRYGPIVRLYGAVSFLFLQLVRLGTILYLLAIPVGFLTGLPMLWVIILTGVVCAFYTAAGGIRAVIWTDVAQTLILLGGGFLCAWVIIRGLPGGIGQVFQVASEHGKFGLGAMKWDLGERTFWTMILLGMFNWLTEYSSNQNVVQRYLAAASMREARKATAICALMSVPTWVFFFFLGTCLFVYYRVFPAPALTGMEAERVLPYFILTSIPAGIAGIIIAGVLAAAMSSLDSSINAISTISTTDLLKRWLARDRGDAYYLRAARVISGIASILMIVGAMIFNALPKESMVDLGIIIGALFGGCLMGLYMIGFFSRRVDYVSAVVALAAATLFNVYLMLNTLGWLPAHLKSNIHTYWVGIVVNLSFAAVAYGVSLLRNRPPRNLEGLTVWTMSSPDAEERALASV